MKKIIALALSLVFALSLAACSRRDMDDTKSDMSSMTSSVKDKAESVTDKTESAAKNAADKAEGSMKLMAKITAKEAVEKALSHAGLKESEVTDIDTDLDRDNGVLVYEVDFNHGSTEYDYDIDAQTGEIISADKSHG